MEFTKHKEVEEEHDVVVSWQISEPPTKLKVWICLLLCRSQRGASVSRAEDAIAFRGNQLFCKSLLHYTAPLNLTALHCTEKYLYSVLQLSTAACRVKNCNATHSSLLEYCCSTKKGIILKHKSDALLASQLHLFAFNPILCCTDIALRCTLSRCTVIQCTAVDFGAIWCFAVLCLFIIPKCCNQLQCKALLRCNMSFVHSNQSAVKCTLL